MKALKKAAVIFFCSLFLCIQVSAAEYGWFFKSGAAGEQPSVMDGSSLPDRYGCLYLGSKGDKTVYLTFDAGYENGNDEKILDVLKAHSAPAAFFILPNLVRQNTELVLRMADEGHLVCNHSKSHRNMARVKSFDEFEAEITGLEDIYREITGREMAKYFRPPEGTYSEQMLEYCTRAGVTPVFWSFAYADWDNSAQWDCERAYNKIVSNLHDGMVMLLHPTSATNAAILDRVLCYIESQGYRFGTLDELKLSVLRGNGDDAFSIDEYVKSGEVYTVNPEKRKVVALTFDDGPHPTQTDEILQVLDEYGVKATFFVLGTNAEKYPDVLRRVIAAGHEIGNHTYSHSLLSKKGTARFFDDAEKNRLYLKDEFGVETRLLRPPGGCFTEEALKKAGELEYKYVLWSWETDARDWAGTSASVIASTIEKNMHGGDVILLHDSVVGKSHTAEALRILIPYLLSEGYSFDTVSGLFSEE